ncbi:hypothetical protein [Marisediminicola sp. LYQ134]|uniref:hypothetical protein n=1 Tax=Marisediminicola sp. LYQ134 TaxID=3391061 RepID=UPI00398308F3
MSTATAPTSRLQADLLAEVRVLEAPVAAAQEFMWRSYASNCRGRCFSEFQVRALMGAHVADGQEYFVSDEAPGSPWAQVVVDGESGLVFTELGRIGHNELLALVIAGESDIQVEIVAPWNTADVIPVYKHGLVHPEVAARAVWSWLNGHEIDGMWSMRVIIPGPHRRS